MGKNMQVLCSRATLKSQVGTRVGAASPAVPFISSCAASPFWVAMRRSPVRCRSWQEWRWKRGAKGL